MNQFKCRHCDKPAHFYFRDGGMLCPDHGALHATAQMKNMLERSRLDKSSCGGVDGHAAGVVPVQPVHSIRWGIGSETRHNGSQAGVESCPQDSISPPSVLSPPEAGALADTLLPVTAGAAYSACLSSDCRHASDDRPVGSSGTPGQDRPLTSFNRSNTTMFRVAASSLIHESSDIPNHHQ